jgi:RHS repeat-associated protein
MNTSIQARRSVSVVGALVLAAGMTVTDDLRAQGMVGVAGFTSAGQKVNFGGPSANPSLVAVDGPNGAATSTLTFEFPAARGVAQPELALHYLSASGDGDAGLGWRFGLPVIERKPLNGFPNPANDPANISTHVLSGATDRFVYLGQALVPLCTVGASSTPCPSGETMPSWASGWSYFRLEYDTLGARLFWSPNGDTWRVQLKSGETMELGYEWTVGNPGSSTANGAIDTDGPGKSIFRWNLSRRWDSQGVSNGSVSINQVIYTWTQLDSFTPALGYLTDIYDTPQASNSPPAAYAHHVHLDYEPTTYNFVTVATPAVEYQVRHWLLQGVDVASMSMSLGNRYYVRRYHLLYSPGQHHSLLQSFQVEGACSPPVVEGNASSCPTLPATTMQYLAPPNVMSPVTPTAAQFYGSMPLANTSTPPSVAFTIMSFPNGGSSGPLPALVQNGGNATMPTSVWRSTFNNNEWQLTMVVPLSVPSATSSYPPDSTTLLGPPGVIASGGFESHSLVGDWWGDGSTQVLFQADTSIPVNCYIYEANQSCEVCSWTLMQTPTPCAAPATVVGDINGDGIVDTTGPAEGGYHTALSGRQPNGTIRPFASEPPLAGVPNLPGFELVDGGGDGGVAPPLQGPPAQLIDMNGDGLDDYVVINTDNATFATVMYAPAGNSLESGAPFGSWVTMPNIPISLLGSVEVWELYAGPWLHDLNGDGLADFIVPVTNDTGQTSFEIFWNVDGSSFNTTNGSVSLLGTGMTTIGDAAQVLFGDMNGSGVDDVVVWNGSNGLIFFDFQYGATPPAGRPGLLTNIQNGLGVSSTVSYFSSAEIGSVPTVGGTEVVDLVQNITTTVAEASGASPRRWVEDYSFEFPAYDGWEHRMRGFEEMIVRTTNNSAAAGTNHSTRQTLYTLAACGSVDEPCPQALVDQDGQRIFPALPATIYDYGDNLGYTPPVAPGFVLPTFGATGMLNRAMTMVHWQANGEYTGLDNRMTWVVYPSTVDTYLYNVANPSGTTTSVPGTGLTVVPYPGAPPTTIPSSGTEYTGPGTRHIEQTQVVDAFGNITSTSDLGIVGTDQAINWSATYEIATGTDWAWRMHTQTSASFPAVSGSDPVLYPRTYTYSYDTSGNLSTVTHVLTNPLASLSRPEYLNVKTYEPTAPQPPSASVSGSTLTLASYTYDSYGNVKQVSRPNANTTNAPGRCKELGYDTVFNQLLTSITEYVAGCGSTTDQVTTLSYNRGLGEVTLDTAPNSASMGFTYDPFGRLASVVGPDPTTGIADTTLATITYQDIPGFAWRRLIVTPAGQTYVYTDGSGQELLRLRTADPSQGDTAPWIGSGWVDLSHIDQRVTKYDPFPYSGDPTAYPGTANPSSPTMVTTFDVFGRAAQVTGRDGAPAAQIVYHAVSTDFWDSGNLDKSSSHYGQTTTKTLDGHGRPTTFAKLGLVNGTQDTVTTSLRYLATGEVSRVTKTDGSTGASYQHWMTYDSLGRMVMNAEPNASLSFSANANGATFSMWQYAYDDVGDLIGTSDARHCGENVYRDGLGRVTAEDYSPCNNNQALYSSPNFSTGAGIEASYVYDAPESGEGSTYYQSATFLIGHLAASSDRGSHTRYSYDGAGRLVGKARQVAGPGGVEYAPTWNSIASTYDSSNRLVSQTTGADVSSLMTAGSDGFESYVTFGYSARGLLTSVGSSYGALMTGYTADTLGRPLTTTLGDLASTTGTYAYDTRGRTTNVTIGRSAPALWTTGGGGGYTIPSPTPPTVLEDLQIGYDTANNPTSFTDNRYTTQWPAGAQPMSRTATYDDAYQLTQLTYTTGDTTWTSPFAYEVSQNSAGPVPGKIFSSRVKAQAWNYDYLGNMTSFSDDTNSVLDRSLGGTAVYGSGPNQMVGADSISSGYAMGAAYDAAGNLAGLTAVRTGSCSSTDGGCNEAFGYQWDELGRLASARRWDLTTTPLGPADLPATDATAVATYLYSGMERVYQEYYDATSGGSYTLNIFPSLRLEHTTASGSDYVRSSTTEIVYLAGLGRVVYGTLPSPSGNPQHVYLELGDPIGSTDIVVDRETSELVERRTDQAFGSEETDYRPTRWDSLREASRFTGKEDDVAFGLAYFGARYYAPALGRWMSPDPLAVHGALGDINPYAYVGNSPLSHVDPLGLDEEGDDPGDDNPGGEAGYGSYGGQPGGGGGGGGSGGGSVVYPPSYAPAPPGPVPVFGPPVIQDSGHPAASSRGSINTADINGPQIGAGAKDSIIDNAKIGNYAMLVVNGILNPAFAALAFPAVRQLGTVLDQAKTPAAQQHGWAYNLGKWGTTALAMAAGGVVGVLESGAENAVAASSRALGNALEEAGFVRGAGEAAHHIVAGAAPEAAAARAILSQFGVGINDAANGVFLPGNLAAENAAGAAVHSTIHTAAYYQAVNEALAGATTQSQVLDILAHIAESLQSGGFP